MKRIIMFYCIIAAVVGIYANNDSLKIDSIQQKVDYEIVDLDNSVMTKSMGDSAFIRGDYVSAISIYENILENQGEAAEIYYNLGNSYFKNNNIAKSLVNLERALLLEPGNGDIRFNLDLVRSKTVDKVTPIGEVFFVTWFRSMKNWFSVDEWAKIAVSSFFILIASFILYILGSRIVLKKIGFILSILMFLIVILANIFAYSQKNVLIDREYAIIMKPSVTVKSTPNMNSTDLFVVHEGHKVAIKDTSMKDWVEIKLEDGNVGWIPENVIEII